MGSEKTEAEHSVQRAFLEKMIIQAIVGRVAGGGNLKKG